MIFLSSTIYYYFFYLAQRPPVVQGWQNFRWNREAT